MTARGKILSMNKLPSGAYKNQRVEFQITHDMVPSFRVVVFAHYKDELIADSLKIDVERECNPNVEVFLFYFTSKQQMISIFFNMCIK